MNQPLYVMNSEMITDYHKERPFSSFLPGVAGTTGIPIWCFYVNRGQGISGFGIKDKNCPIMEFFPANQAYQYVNTYGFRTFIKIDGRVVEPFVHTPDTNSRTMYISKDSFSITEDMQTEGLHISVTYSTLSDLPVGGLIRRVIIKNESQTARTMEIIDGMPVLIPYGITNASFKEMSNLGRSWMQVSHADVKTPFFNLRAGTSDEAEVSISPSGYFYMNQALNEPETAVFYDASLLFNYRTDLSEAVGFAANDLSLLASMQQIPENKVPCAFQGLTVQLESGQEKIIDSVIGYAKSYDKVEAICRDIDFNAFISEQLEQGKMLIDEITSDVAMESGKKHFDAYISQSYLDNILRGGKPYILGEKQTVCHLYSRKHGDQEREYNFFSIEPKFYSQGNGNYRDVNQNRRHDVSFEPRVGDFNIWMFYNLVQSDGYNPLSINGIKYKISRDKMTALSVELQRTLGISEEVLKILSVRVLRPFTPGDLLEALDDDTLSRGQTEMLIGSLLDAAEAEIEASFGEGFWSDHFTYNLDLVEDFLSIYPEKLKELLFQRTDYKIYSAPEYVLPRHMKIGLNKEGKVRQFGSLAKKEAYYGNWMKDQQGEVIYTDLFNKMLMLVLNKFLNLDPSNMGIEMEANKPGWNDAMNGLPGLLGSGLSESIELLRHIKFMSKSLNTINTMSRYDASSQKGEILEGESVKVLEPLMKLVEALESSMEHLKSDRLTPEHMHQTRLDSWSIRNQIKETYREATRDNYSNESSELSKVRLISLLDKMSELLQDGLENAMEIGDGIMPTYLIHSVEDFKSNESMTPYGLESVEPLSFTCRCMPYFLEAPARHMKSQDKVHAEAMYYKIKASGMYDKELKMYKTSESLEEEGFEIGRIRAFTAGWLERESVFLHMEYKYLLSLAKAGLWPQFYEATDTALVSNLSKEVYGRPTTENSSFIASSVNPDPAVRGQGFVARLSGSTAEILSMWRLMMIGKDWFSVEGEELTFKFSPNLTGDYFDDDGFCRFNLLSDVHVTYVNPSKRNTFGKGGAMIQEMKVDGITVTSDTLKGNMAYRLREREIKEIIVFFVPLG